MIYSVTRLLRSIYVHNLIHIHKHKVFANPLQICNDISALAQTALSNGKMQTSLPYSAMSAYLIELTNKENFVTLYPLQ